MNNRKPIGPSTYIAMGAILVILLAGYFFGLTSRGSGLRVGYSDSYTGSQWQARYMLLTGFRERTVNIGNEAATLHVEITTDGGAVDLTVTDMQGNVVYSQENIPTSSFDVEIPGTVIVRVTGADHSGSFLFQW